jgi:hypothetical protein
MKLTIQLETIEKNNKELFAKKGEVQVKKILDEQFTTLIKAKIIFDPN